MDMDSRRFRDALGHFATGVAVVSARGPGGQPVGLTINSFASVSLDPPLVLWSLDRGSDRFGVYEGAPAWGINVLASADRPLSQRLARKGDGSLAGEALRDGAHGVPLLERAIAHFTCVPEHQYAGGDHIILVGRVVEFGHAGHDAPLVYFRGAYRDIG